MRFKHPIYFNYRKVKRAFTRCGNAVFQRCVRYSATFFLALILFLCSSCFMKPVGLRQGDSDWGVHVVWYGHSCFSLIDSTGRTVVIDPFDESVGYGFLRLRADALIITHHHFDHNDNRAVRPRRQTLDLADSSTGTLSMPNGLTVTGIASDHDSFQGKIHGPNTIYVFSMGGLRFAHLGDLGQIRLTENQLKEMGEIDVVFIPVGGVTTINARQAAGIVEQLKPSFVFPMHYGRIRFYPLDSVDEFLSLYSSEQLINGPQSGIRIRRSELGSLTRVVVLDPASQND